MFLPGSWKGALKAKPLIQIPGFDGLDGVSKCLFQNALADGPEHEAEHPPFEVLALAYHIGIHIGRPRYYQRASNGPVRSRPARSRETWPELGSDVASISIQHIASERRVPPDRQGEIVTGRELSRA